MAAAKQKYKKMDMQTSMKLRILHQECRLSAYKLVKRYRKLYAERTIYRHAKKPVDEVTPFDIGERKTRGVQESCLCEWRG